MAPSPRCCSSAAIGFGIDRHFVAMVELTERLGTRPHVGGAILSYFPQFGGR
jgi:hypothetical protein